MSGQTLLSFQPAPIPDGPLPGQSRLPYPVHAWAIDGVIPAHLGGTPGSRIVGFTRDPERQQMDASWQTIAYHPDDAVGMYVVLQNDMGYTVLTSPIQSVEVRDFQRPEAIDPLNAPVDSAHRWGRWTE